MNFWRKKIICVSCFLSFLIRPYYKTAHLTHKKSMIFEQEMCVNFSATAAQGRQHWRSGAAVVASTAVHWRISAVASGIAAQRQWQQQQWQRQLQWTAGSGAAAAVQGRPLVAWALPSQLGGQAAVAASVAAHWRSSQQHSDAVAVAAVATAAAAAVAQRAAVQRQRRRGGPSRLKGQAALAASAVAHRRSSAAA